MEVAADVLGKGMKTILSINGSVTAFASKDDSLLKVVRAIPYYSNTHESLENYIDTHNMILCNSVLIDTVLVETWVNADA